MTLIVSDLYERIMQANTDEFDCLRVITGYSSGDFIKKVLSDFPNLNIELYLGMAQQGISTRDHDYYRSITQNGIAKVCYVIDKPMIHQKVMEFYSSRDHIGYVGSANFSFNGFFEQREIMVVADNNLDAVFQMAASQSMSCLDEQIENVIPLVEVAQTEDSSATENHFGEQNDVREEKPIERESESDFGAGVQWQNLPYYRYDEYIDIPIIRKEVAPEQAPINDDIPYLSLDGVKEYGAVLPSHQVFELSTASQVIEADTESKFGRSLRFHDVNMKELIAQKLQISADTLFTVESVGNVKLRVGRLREGSYYMELVKDNQKGEEKTF